MLKQVRIPNEVPAYVEVELDAFHTSEEMTVAEWRAAQRLAKQLRSERPPVHPSVNKMVRLAKTLQLPDDLRLLPRLRDLVATYDDIISTL